MRTETGIQNVVDGLRAIGPAQFDHWIRVTIEFYIFKLIKKHFLRGYARARGWRPNSPEYQEYKRRRFGDLPQLVLSGRLRAAAQTGKPVRKRKGDYVIRWNAGRYGQVQIQKYGRDWASPSNKDEKDMMRYIIKEIRKIRKDLPGLKVIR